MPQALFHFLMPLSLALVVFGCTPRVTGPVPVLNKARAHDGDAARADQALRDAVLRELLALPSVIDGYGTVGSRDVAIFSDVAYQPRLPPGWTLIDSRRDNRPENERPRLLGIRIEAIAPIPEALPNPSEWRKPAFYGVTIFNAGGTSNGGVHGYCSGSVCAEATDAGCRVQILALLDP